MAKTTGVKKAKVTKNTKEKGNIEEPVVAPPTPEPTSQDGSEAGTDESEPAEETAPVSNHGKQSNKAPVANMASESTSSGTKRSREGNEEKSAKKKKTTAAPTTETTSTVRPASCSEPIAFNSPIFECFIGPTKYQFFAHQAILMQSPVLEKLCLAQANKKGRAKTSLLLPHEKPINFATLLEYLYSGQVKMNLPVELAVVEGASNSAAEEEVIAKTAKRLAKLYCVGASYELVELQNHVTKILHDTKLWEKLPGMEFFELAERLYPEDFEEADGDSFAKFFADHAPAMIRTVPENRMSELLRMVSSGGAFAEAVFMAFNTAARAGLAKASGLKVEEQVDGRHEGSGHGSNGDHHAES